METSSSVVTVRSTGLRGMSEDGKWMVQTRQGGGYMILKQVEGCWARVAETEFYSNACLKMDLMCAAEAVS